MSVIRLTAIAVVLALIGPLMAAETSNLLEVSMGIFDFDNDSAGEARLEWRGQPMLGVLQPMVGAMGTTEGSAYAYAGLALELWLDERVVLTPSAAVGAYRRGGGKDLGQTLEFRTGATIQYRFDDNSRVGMAFHHLSNAGFADRNPGAESLMVSYTWPFGK
jgi:lipid A 3-O-deacylase